MFDWWWRLLANDRGLDLAYRAERQHALLMSGDVVGGLYGDYPPDNMFLPVERRRYKVTDYQRRLIERIAAETAAKMTAEIAKGLPY